MHKKVPLFFRSGSCESCKPGQIPLARTSCSCRLSRCCSSVSAAWSHSGGDAGLRAPRLVGTIPSRNTRRVCLPDGGFETRTESFESNGKHRTPMGSSTLIPPCGSTRQAGAPPDAPPTRPPGVRAARVPDARAAPPTARQRMARTAHPLPQPAPRPPGAAPHDADPEAEGEEEQVSRGGQNFACLFPVALHRPLPPPAHRNLPYVVKANSLRVPSVPALLTSIPSTVPML